jgi:transcriptional regulator GlxA family with amidase domain
VGLPRAAQFFLCGGGLVASAIGSRPDAPSTVLTEQEQAATIAGLRPPKRKRPVVAILADAKGAETTDLLMPFGVLSRTNLADVFVAAETSASITLMPAFRIDPQITFADLDQGYPDGADYVIVPALHRVAEPKIIDWIRRCTEAGATIIGICEGAMTVAAAGLLDGRRGTTHWFKVAKLCGEHPSIGMSAIS